MAQLAPKVLVIGYGNPGRWDDGLGPALADRLAEARLPVVTVDSDYQLVVEDAAAVAECDVVVFADAAATGPGPFSFSPLRPAGGAGFSTHGVQPGEVLALARDLFGATAAAYVLAIRGYRFDGFGEQLSPAAGDNLDRAERFLRGLLTGPDRGLLTDPDFHERSTPADRARADRLPPEDRTCKTESK